MALSEAGIQELADSIVHGSEERMVAELFARLCASMADGAIGLADEAALEQLASANAAMANGLLAEYAGAIDDETRALVESALLDASDADEASLAAVYGQEAASQAALAFAGGYSTHFAEIAAQTAAGVAEVVRRQNLAMAERAERLWYEAAGEAVTAFNQGLLPREECVARAVSRLMADGMETVDYASGVSSQLDVAVRRHVVTQASQAGGRMTLDRLEAYGHELVVTSAHYGARPSHAEWQGKPCAIHGPAEVDGVRYPGLAELTGYGTVGGLKGANCRHSINPYYPGITALPAREWPEHEARFGMSSGEYYEATQRQRELERRVRKTKREIAGMEQAGIGLESPTYAQKRLTLGRQQAALRDHCAKNGLVRQYAREKAYGVKSQPRALAKEPWKRTADELLRTPAAERSLKARGITKKVARQGIADAMAERGGTLADFATMTAGEQQSVFRGIVEKLNGTAKAKRGKHADVLAGALREKPMTFEEADGGMVNPRVNEGVAYWTNCQTCVVAFEARLRGYRVVAKGYDSGTAMKDLAINPAMAWTDPKTGTSPVPFRDWSALTPKKFLNLLETTVKSGERYTLRFANQSNGDGHIVNLDRTPDGGLRIYDPQTGSVYLDADLRNYVRRFTFRGTKNGVKAEYPPAILRVDNLEFNRKIVDAILEEARK